MSFTYEFPKMDRTQGPHWQGLIKAVLELAGLRGHPIEDVLSPENPYIQDYPMYSWEDDNHIYLVFAQEITPQELAALQARFADSTNICKPGMTGWGPPTGTRLILQDIYNRFPKSFVTNAGVTSSGVVPWVARSNPAVMHPEDWDLLYLDFSYNLTKQQRGAIENYMITLFQWVIP